MSASIRQPTEEDRRSRIFVAGATGVIGLRLIPLLVAGGHTVAAMTRTASKANALRALGAQPVVCDVFDATSLQREMLAFLPEILIDELTDLPDDPGRVRELERLNNRMRREGTRNVLEAAHAADVDTLIVESVAWKLPGDSQAAVDEMERATLAEGGIVLRYGRLYGPGTYYQVEKPDPPRIHADDAARRTLLALFAAPGSVIELSESIRTGASLSTKQEQEEAE
jgi:hypothetical protein